LGSNKGGLAGTEHFLQEYGTILRTVRKKKKKKKVNQNHETQGKYKPAKKEELWIEKQRDYVNRKRLPK